MGRPLDVVGMAEVADMLAVHRVTVHRWLADGTMPLPDVVLRSGPVWRTSRVRRWAERTGRHTWRPAHD